MRTAILLLLFACAAPPPSTSVSVAPIGWIDGQAFPISRAFVFAKNHENTQWEVVLASERGFPADFSGSLDQARVDFGGRSHKLDGIGGSPGVAYFEFGTGKEDAATCASLLGIEARGRVDPKLLLRSRLVPVTGADAESAPRTARFVLENGGPCAFTFLDSGAGQVLERDARFQLTIERDGVVVPEIAPPIDFGGMQRQLTLEPGASHSFELDLGAWASFDQPGLYRIRAQLRLELQAAASHVSEPFEDEYLRWDATSTAECEFRVD